MSTDDSLVLVTGGTGFLGKHVMKEFARQGIPAVTFPRVTYDLTRIESARQMVLKVKPKVMVHMAASCGGIGANKTYPADFINSNAMMACNVFDVARSCGVEYVYTLGTACAYPKNCPVPFKETSIWDGMPDETNFPYASTKLMMIVMHDAYRNQYGLKGAQLIPTNLYGEYDHFGLKDSHVMPALIRKFVSAKNVNDHAVDVWGSGKATREFLYAGDAARAIVLAASKRLDSSVPMNIGSGEEVSIRRLAGLIRDEVGYEGNIVYLDDGTDGQPRRGLDTTFARDALGFVAEVPLREGIKRTIEWYKTCGDCA